MPINNFHVNVRLHLSGTAATLQRMGPSSPINKYPTKTGLDKIYVYDQA